MKKLLKKHLLVFWSRSVGLSGTCLSILRRVDQPNSYPSSPSQWCSSQQVEVNQFGNSTEQNHQTVLFCPGIFLIEASTEHDQEEVLVMLHVIDNIAIAYHMIEWVSISQLCQSTPMGLFTFLISRYFLRLLVCPNKKNFISDKMNLVDLVGILPAIFNIILAGLENMKIIGQARDRPWSTTNSPSRRARSWGLWGWWDSCASSGWFDISSASKVFSTHSTRWLARIAIPSFY